MVAPESQVLFALENLRQRVLLPQQFRGQSLIDGLLLALRPAAAPAALDDLGALNLIVPCPREDVVSLTGAVGHHTRHLLEEKKELCARHKPENRLKF